MSAAPGPILHDPSGGPMRAALHLVYDIAWLTVLAVAAPYWIWRCLRERGYRLMTAARLGFSWPDLARLRPGGRRILVHGVSVGEVKGARALVAGLRARHPECEIVVSTTTNTGETVARSEFPDTVVVRWPVDVSFLVRRFLARIDPACIVLVELEIWPNLLRSANRRGCPVVVVNGRITQRSFARYHRFRHTLPQFSRVTLFCVQDVEHAERFDALIGAGERTVVTGNIKVDGLRSGRLVPPEAVARLLAPCGAGAVLVCGSTHEPEERWLVEAWRERLADVRLVLVPRHPERGAELARALPAIAGRGVQRWSELAAGAAVPDPAAPCIVDAIGLLEGIYALADVVFVGGSLVPHGGQNMLEPAAQGRAVVYGPHVGNFVQEAALLERSGAAVRLARREDLAAQLGELLADDARRERMGRAGLAAVEAQKGATARTLDALDERVLVHLLAPSA